MLHDMEKEIIEPDEQCFMCCYMSDALDIEDKIADMQMIDPLYLDAYYKLHPERKVDSDEDKKKEKYEQ